VGTALTIASGVVLVLLIAAGLAAAIAPPRTSRYSNEAATTEAGHAEQRIRSKLYRSREDDSHQHPPRENRTQERP
jgi:hypothetical protein